MAPQAIGIAQNGLGNDGRSVRGQTRINRANFVSFLKPPLGFWIIKILEALEPKDNLPEMPAFPHVLQGRARLGPREDAIDHRPHLMQ